MPPFSPGFRLSRLDIAVLLIGTCASSVVALFLDRWIALAIAFVIAHFFLFCNILRMSRPLELIWAFSFAALATAATASFLTWPVAFTCSAIITLILATIESRRPSYHGIAWQRLNPHLPEWWQSHHSSHPISGTKKSIIENRSNT
ncbi:MAG TPA: hypothetical protein VFE58_12840 [Tepidisphaeraceae bacterium]|jgi:hypothetical protein|nr:hypothetical protein [Tepidisphaeraceae bacterium]